MINYLYVTVIFMLEMFYNYLKLVQANVLLLHRF